MPDDTDFSFCSKGHGNDITGCSQPCPCNRSSTGPAEMIDLAEASL